MNFSDLQTALFRRGFDDLNDAGNGLTEAKRWLNQAYKEICRAERWPFLAATASGAAPLTIADLGAVESVRDTAQNSFRLVWRERRDLVNSYNDLTTTGTPSWFYIDNGVIRTYPVGGTLTVLYWKAPASMSANGDTPLLPEDWHEVIVHRAAWKAHVSRQNWEAAANEKGVADSLLEEMRTDLLDQQDDSTATIAIVAGAGDW